MGNFTVQKMNHKNLGEIERAELTVYYSDLTKENTKDLEKVGEFFKYEIDIVKKKGEDLSRFVIQTYIPGMCSRPLEHKKGICAIDGYELLLLSKETDIKNKEYIKNNENI